MSGDFNPEQKRYLEGFVTGLQIAKATRGQGPGRGPRRAGPARCRAPPAAGARARAGACAARGRHSRSKPTRTPRATA